MRETSVPGKQISTMGIQDLGEVAIQTPCNFAARSDLCHEVGKEGRTLGPKTLTLAFAKAKPGGEGKNKQRPLRPQCSGRNNMLSELSAIAEVSDIFPAANSYVLSTSCLEL